MNTVADSTPNPPDSTHCGLMPLAAGREAVGDRLTYAENLRVLDLLRLDAQRAVNAGRRADPLTITAMDKIRKEVDEHQREFQRLMSVL